MSGGKRLALFVASAVAMPIACSVSKWLGLSVEWADYIHGGLAVLLICWWLRVDFSRSSKKTGATHEG